MPKTNRRKGKKRRTRILMLVHADLVPPDDLDSLDEKLRHEMQSELDVGAALTSLGYEVQYLGLDEEFWPLRKRVETFRPHLVFNLLEEFRGKATYDFNVVAYLELLRVPYTGCNARGLILGRDKALSKKIVTYHDVSAPSFEVFRRGRKVRLSRPFDGPMIVKSLIEDSSMGMSEASLVHSEEKLVERIAFMHDSIHTHAIAEQYVEGREIYVTVLGHNRIKTLPPWELVLDRLRPGAPRIATHRVKWDKSFQSKYNVVIEEAVELSSGQLKKLDQVSRRVYKALNMSGYARIDYRLREDGRLFFLEANPNPDISRESEASGAAESEGLSYEELINRIVHLGLNARN
jgi:D-alanine-D-alanine ligase